MRLLVRCGRAEVFLAEGATCAIGRAPRDLAPDATATLELGQAPDLSRLVATVGYQGRGVWWVAAHSEANGVRVIDADGSRMVVPVGARRSLGTEALDQMVVVSTMAREYEVSVAELDGEGVVLAREESAARHASPTQVLRADPAKADHRALVALCAPPLHNRIDGEIPTETAVADLLNAWGVEADPVTTRIVSKRLERMREFFGVRSNRELVRRSIDVRFVTAQSVDELRALGR
jgi:hypothetical protein